MRRRVKWAYNLGRVIGFLWYPAFFLSAAYTGYLLSQYVFGGYHD